MSPATFVVCGYCRSNVETVARFPKFFASVTDVTSRNQAGQMGRFEVGANLNHDGALKRLHADGAFPLLLQQ